MIDKRTRRDGNPSGHLPFVPADNREEARATERPVGAYRNSSSHVYVFEAGEYVKIGRSNNVKHRLILIKTGCPFEVSIVKSWPTSFAAVIEAAAHRELARHRCAGEWFKIPAQQAVEVVTRLIEQDWTSLDLFASRQKARSVIRNIALQMLQEGVATQSEVAELAGVSRQLVRYWCEMDKIDANSAREQYLQAEWRIRHN